MSDYYEKKARQFLESQGCNPDEYGPIPCPDGIPGCCVAHFGPRWKNYVEKAREIDGWRKVLEP